MVGRADEVQIMQQESLTADQQMAQYSMKAVDFSEVCLTRPGCTLPHARWQLG